MTLRTGSVRRVISLGASRAQNNTRSRTGSAVRRLDGVRVVHARHQGPRPLAPRGRRYAITRTPRPPGRVMAPAVPCPARLSWTLAATVPAAVAACPCPGAPGRKNSPSSPRRGRCRSRRQTEAPGGRPGWRPQVWGPSSAAAQRPVSRLDGTVLIGSGVARVGLRPQINDDPVRAGTVRRVTSQRRNPS